MSESFDVAVTHSGAAELRNSWTNTSVGVFCRKELHLAAAVKESSYFTSAASGSDKVEMQTLTRAAAPSGSQAELDHHTLFRLAL